MNVSMNDFITELSAWAARHNLKQEVLPDFYDRSTMTQFTKAGEVYNKVVDFLNDSNLYGRKNWNNNFCIGASETLNTIPSSDHQINITADSLYALAKECGTPEDQMQTTLANMYRAISQAVNQTSIADHWQTGNNALSPTTVFTGMETIYPQSALADMQVGPYTPGTEAFGATMDTVLPDLRMNLTVILVKPHKGIMSRIIQRRTLQSPVITYQLVRNELYDLQKSQDKDAYIRNEYSHRHNLVELYRRPDPTDMSLTRIEPLKENDTDEDNSKLWADNIILFNTQLNLFNLVLDETKEYRKRFNYTDLVSEGVMVDSIYVHVNESGDEKSAEHYKLDVKDQPKARFMHLQTSEQFSGDRETTLKVYMPLSRDTVTMEGKKSEIFKDIDPTVEYVQLVVSGNFHIDLMTSDVESTGRCELRMAAAKKGEEPSETLQEKFKKLDVRLLGYELDARFSEENLRQIDRAARSLTYLQSYEMPQGKTIIVDFSANQTMPEQVLNVAQELQAIGIDHRNMQMFLKTMRYVHDTCQAERNDELYNEHVNGKTINRQFISGQQVNPEIFMGTLDLANVNSIRDSDLPGDIRQYSDSYLTKVFSILHYRSQYLTQLDASKVPTYKIITSAPILENLLALPHIHDHLMPNGMNTERLYKEKNPGDPIEYVRVLQSGVKLEVITSSFYYLEDKIIALPYIDGDPSNVLNFAHNWDMGQFVANYTPVDGNQFNRRVFMNTREWPIVTCPIGAIIEVKNLAEKLPDIYSA